MLKRLLLILLALPSLFSAHAQDTSKRFAGDTMRTIVIDTSALLIAKRGLHEQDFIDQILRDTSFYQAFHELRTYSFLSEYNIKTFDKSGGLTAHIIKNVFHDNSGPSYLQRILSKSDSGDVYKRNGKYKLFTIQMFSYIFENDKSSDFKSDGPVSGTEETYKKKLEQLIFRPGTRIEGLPFISGKTEIFSPEMRKYYTYKFSSASYLGHIPVYRFECKVKPEFLNDGSVIIKELTTIFDKKNFQILGRFLNMNYENLLFSFDVRMNIQAAYVGDQILPVLIQYAGNWDIPFKKKEISSFLIKLHDFKPKGQPYLLKQVN